MIWTRGKIHRFDAATGADGSPLRVRCSIEFEANIQTEAHIEEALARLLADRTAFVVAHRLSTIRNADLIVVLEHGRVVEAGTHDVLLEQAGRYRALYGDWAEAIAG